MKTSLTLGVIALLCAAGAAFVLTEETRASAEPAGLHWRPVDATLALHDGKRATGWSVDPALLEVVAPTGTRHPCLEWQCDDLAIAMYQAER